VSPELERRPLVLLATGLILGLISLAYLPTLAFLGLAACAARGRGAWIALGTGFLLGLLLAPHPAPLLTQDQKVSGIGRVATIPKRYVDATSFVMEVDGRRFQVTSPIVSDVALGDRLTVDATAKPPREGSDRYFALGGLSGRIFLPTIDRVAEGPWPYHLAQSSQRAFLGFVAGASHPRVAAVVGALCVNAGALLDEETQRGLQRTGTIHLISASGLHVFVLGVLVEFLLTLIGIPRAGMLTILALLLGGYALMTGLQPPILRAGVMLMTLRSAYLFRREPDFASALALAAVLILLWNPANVYDIGFQLSFCTVGMMGVLLKVAPDKDPLWIRAPKDTLRTSIAAFAASAPLLLYHFGQLPLLSVAANLFVAAFATVVVVAAPLAFAVSFALPSVAAGAMSLIVVPSTAAILWLLDRTEGLNATVIRVPDFSGYWVAIVYVLAVSLWRPPIAPVAPKA